MRVISIGILLAACGATEKAQWGMERVESGGIPAPPADKALVVFHRPSSYVWKGDVEIYDGTKLVGDITGKQTCYTICAPGKHMFVAQSEGSDVVDATHAAGKTYDIVLDVASGWWGARIELHPLNKGDERRKELAEWLAETPIYRLEPNHWRVKQLEDKRRQRNEDAIRDYTTGEKKDRLLTMGPDDHR